MALFSICSTVWNRPALIHTVVLQVVMPQSAWAQTTRCHNPEDHRIIFTSMKTSNYV